MNERKRVQLEGGGERRPRARARAAPRAALTRLAERGARCGAADTSRAATLRARPRPPGRARPPPPAARRHWRRRVSRAAPAASRLTPAARAAAPIHASRIERSVARARA
ncbi:hypothetical protein RR48_08341 [Papilio machaon]|uniref:Uncharacterized protein n=1 Tax=Papilio machaon TaxID=76193 RepID=A0A194R257_PAPMA|nr:hypothetical protein RR48_08341 [Papilio machaon]